MDDVWSCDLVEMQEWSKQNKGYRCMLNIVDCFSKYAWSVPLKDKSAKVVLAAFKLVVKQLRDGRGAEIPQRSAAPKHIWVDEGKEFYNKDMTAWINQHNIVRYSTYGEHKSAVVERFDRTLKTAMWKRFTAENTRNWVDMLDKLLLKYNTSIHSAIRMKPIDAVLETNRLEVLDNIAVDRGIRDKTSKFKLGDSVRISRVKGLFEKGYLPNWSEALYTIREVKSSSPITYLLKVSQGKDVKGGFYKEELQRSNQEIFRIEKILRKKLINGVRHSLVKWIGYDSSFNQWVPSSDIQDVPRS